MRPRIERDPLAVAKATVRRVRPGEVSGRPAVAQPGRVQQNQLARVLHRQRLEQQPVDDAEDRGVRPNAKRERQHGHCRESGLCDEPPARVANVLPEIGEHQPPASLFSCVIVDALGPPIDVRANVRSIDILERGGEACPVRDLCPGVSVGIGLGHATRRPPRDRTLRAATRAPARCAIRARARGPATTDGRGRTVPNHAREVPMTAFTVATNASHVLRCSANMRRPSGVSR